MNQLPYVNSKVIKEVFYDSTLQPTATTMLITVENVPVNAFIHQVVFYLATAEAAFGSLLSLSFLDRGNGYPQPINGFDPITFTTISTSNVMSPSSGTFTPQNVVQNGLTVIVNVNQSVQDSEGLGNFYIQLSKLAGTFNKNFTMAVVYSPEVTFNQLLTNRNQSSNDKRPRMLSQSGVGSYLLATSTMVDQTNTLANYYHARNNVDNVDFGFNVFSTSPIFYFGTPYKTTRWFVGFSSDCTQNIGIVTFSYFNGSNYVGLLTTQVFNGAQGPGTYKFAFDGVVIFNPPANWSPVNMPNDPLTKYNTTLIGLGTLATNNTVSNPALYWIQCQVGFAATATLRVSTIVPLIAPDLPITFRRRLI